MTTPPSTIGEVVRAAARQFGGHEALADGRTRLTFAEVADLVDRRADALAASGVRVGDRVAIWAPNGVDWVLCALATYAAGAVLVPVNTRFKGAEAAALLDRVHPRLLFTVTDFLGTEYVDALNQSGGADVGEVVVLSGPVPSGAVSLATFAARATTTAGPAGRRLPLVGPSSPSDIIFTSGTTGTPKGVLLHHGPSVETYRQWSARAGLRRGDRMLGIFPFFHTAGLKAGILAAFLRGATLVPSAVFDTDQVLGLVADERISFLPGPPAVFLSLLDHPDLDRVDLASLRTGVTGGASAGPDLIDVVRRRLSLASVVNGYGLTETHGTVSVGDDRSPPGSVGQPLDGLELRIVNDGDVGVGEPGEVLVRGFNVTTGYVDDPAATAAAVVDGWLATGDVGFVDGDGNLYLVDRKKDLFMVGGFNVAPAEVEQALLRRPDVAEAAVVAAPDRRLGEVGAAFVVAAAGATVSPEEVLGWCREQMANYKVPRHVVVVDALPVNAGGKVRKDQLRHRAAQLAGGATRPTGVAADSRRPTQG